MKLIKVNNTKFPFCSSRENIGSSLGVMQHTSDYKNSEHILQCLKLKIKICPLTTNCEKPSRGCQLLSMNLHVSDGFESDIIWRSLFQLSSGAGMLHRGQSGGQLKTKSEMKERNSQERALTWSQNALYLKHKWRLKVNSHYIASAYEFKNEQT